MVSFQKYQTQNQIICNKQSQNSRNTVKPTKKKISLFKNEITQYNIHVCFSFYFFKYILLLSIITVIYIYRYMYASLHLNFLDLVRYSCLH